MPDSSHRSMALARRTAAWAIRWLIRSCEASRRMVPCWLLVGRSGTVTQSGAPVLVGAGGGGGGGRTSLAVRNEKLAGAAIALPATSVTLPATVTVYSVSKARSAVGSSVKTVPSAFAVTAAGMGLTSLPAVRTTAPSTSTVPSSIGSLKVTCTLPSRATSAASSSGVVSVIVGGTTSTAPSSCSTIGAETGPAVVPLVR